MSHLYLGAVAFGVTLLIASFLLSGKDAHAGGHHAGHADSPPGLGWAPIGSLRFWVFLCAFGGGAGYALTVLGTREPYAGVAALAIGWGSGVLAVGVIRRLTATSTSSSVERGELVGATGTLLLPIAPGKPGKVRIAIKGRNEDFVAYLVDDEPALATGATVLVVAERGGGALLVGKHEL
jgi:membrane protein implicated in regulation of membrane protease activity